MKVPWWPVSIGLPINSESTCSLTCSCIVLQKTCRPLFCENYANSFFFKGAVLCLLQILRHILHETGVNMYKVIFIPRQFTCKSNTAVENPSYFRTITDLHHLYFAWTSFSLKISGNTPFLWHLLSSSKKENWYENQKICNFIEITLRHGCSPVNLLYIRRTTFPKNISGGLLL